MNGLDDLFAIADPPAKGANSASTRVTLNAGHALFSGHFPDRPILPGVVMVHIATRIIGVMIGDPMRIAEARAIKFLAPVDPRVTPVLTFQTALQPAENGTRAEVQASAGDTIVMKLTASVVSDGR
jgi:3-hydroxyacyl-[acyl-carrier-protein] dehydratase